MSNPRIDTLVLDMYRVLKDGVPEYPIQKLADFGVGVTRSMSSTIAVPEKRSRQRPGHFYASEIGHPCLKHLYYKGIKYWDGSPEGEIPSGATQFKFLYGNLIEEAALLVADAAGHDVGMKQARIELQLSNGLMISGKIDALIDGVIVDVKSIQHQGFVRIGDTYSDDKFGYNGQLGTYAQAAHDVGIKVDGHEIKGAVPTKFLFVSKQSGEFKLADPLPFDLKDKVAGITAISHLTPDKMPRMPTVKKPNGNVVLGTVCNYCPFKHECWPGLRTFAYSTGLEHLVHVEKTPQVYEIPSKSEGGTVSF